MLRLREAISPDCVRGPAEERPRPQRAGTLRSFLPLNGSGTAVFDGSFQH